MQEVISDAMEQLLAAHCKPADVRRIEQAAASADSQQRREAGSGLWSALLDSGFVDALVPEERGGSGLELTDVFPVAFVSGRHALPLPLIHTLLVRGILGTFGTFGTSGAVSLPLPDGPIAIAGTAVVDASGSLSCSRVPFGLVADWVLATVDGACRLLPVSEASVSISTREGTLDADMHWRHAWGESADLDVNRDWRVLGACAHSALLAGTLERVLEMTLEYANGRSQFGKPIGRFQAVQQQLSVMAEEVFAAKMAARIGYTHVADSIAIPAASPPASSLRAASSSQAAHAVAVAKARTSAAVPAVTGIAHAVHGAIGFTEEYDLQLYTRRLHDGRMAYGSESFWHRELGETLIRERDISALDFIRF